MGSGLSLNRLSSESSEEENKLEKGKNQNAHNTENNSSKSIAQDEETALDCQGVFASVFFVLKEISQTPLIKLFSQTKLWCKF